MPRVGECLKTPLNEIPDRHDSLARFGVQIEPGEVEIHIVWIEDMCVVQRDTRLDEKTSVDQVSSQAEGSLAKASTFIAIE